MRLAPFVSWILGITLFTFITADTDAQTTPPVNPVKTQRVDAFGDSLPEGAVARIGTTRWRIGGSHLVFSRDGRYLIACGMPTRLIDPGTGLVLRRFNVPSHQAFFMADNKTVMLCESFLEITEQSVRFLDVETGKVVRQLPVGDFWPPFIWSANGKRAANVNHPSPVHNKNFYGTIVWDTESGKIIRQWQNLSGRLALSPDGQTLAVCDSSQISLFDITDGNKRRSWESPLADISDNGNNVQMAFSPDGKILASAEKRCVMLWDPAAGKLSSQLNLPAGQDSPATLEFSADGRYLAAGGYQGSFYVWDFFANKLLFTHSGDRDDSPIYLLAFAPDGKTLISKAHQPGSARLWNIPSGKEKSPDGNGAPIDSLVFSPDGKSVATVSAKDPACLWDAASGKLLHRFEMLHSWHAPTGSLSFQNGGKSLGMTFLCSDHPYHLREQRACVFNVENGRTLVSSQGINQGIDVKKLNFTNSWLDDQNMVVAFPGAEIPAYPNNNLYDRGEFVHSTMIGLWDTRKNIIGKSFRVDAENMRGLSLSRDRTRMIGISSRPDSDLKEPKVFLGAWDYAKGKVLCQYPLAFSPREFFFSADNRSVYLIAPDFGAKQKCLFQLLEVASGKIRKETEHKLDPPAKVSVAIANERLGAVAQNDAIYVIDLFTGKELRGFKTGEGVIKCLALSPDGNSLASASDDTTALIWDIADLNPSLEKITLSEDELSDHWKNLASDNAETAFHSILRMSQTPGQTAALLNGRLQPAPLEGAEKIKGNITKLDSAVFVEREKAMQELLKLGEQAELALAEFLKAPPSLEAQRRAEQILHKLQEAGKKGPYPVAGELLREIRAVELLERIGTPEAADVLGRLSKGSPYALLTREAQASVRRLKDRK
jgi:WD40 repeat protein